MSGVRRYCRWGDHWVPATDATEIYTPTRITGPESPVWACWPHVYEHDLQTTSRPETRHAPLIGRRDAPPLLPSGGAP